MVRATPALRVLGAVELHATDGSVVALPSQKREILAAIAAAGDQPLDRDTLCHSLWGDNSPAHRHRLVSQINQLRTALPPGLEVKFASGGYRLVGPAEAVDATWFERLVDAPTGDDNARADALGTALALWRGPYPFAGTTGALVDDSARRLLLRRDAAVLEMCDVEHRLGRPTTVFEQLMVMFDDDPSRGDVTLRLASALDRAARDLEALRVLSRHRTTLGEHGAVPDRAIDELERLILSHEMTRSTSSTASTQGAPGLLRTLLPRRGLVEDVAHRLGTGALLMIGEPGAGKSILVRQLTERLSPSPTVVHASASPSRPMEAVHNLVVALEGDDGALLEQALAQADHRAAWRCLVNDGSDRAPLLSRDEIVAGLAGLLARLIGASPRPVILEDLHHLDPISLEVLGAVLDTIGLASVPLLLTSRTMPAAIPEALVVMHLPMFTPDEASQLVGDALATRGARLAEEIHRRSGGNPLFLTLLVDVLAAAELEVAMPRTLRFAIESRLAGLSTRAIDVLRVAALLGARFDPAIVATVTAHADDGLREAADEGLLVRDGARWQFGHELIAEHLVANAAPGLRVALHDQLCNTLIVAGGTAIDIAHHAAQAISIDPLRAARWTLAAARELAVVADWAAVIRTVSAGLDGLDPQHDDPLLVDLLTLRGTARRREGASGSDADLLSAAHMAQRLGDDTRLAHATVELCLHGPTSTSGDVDARVAPLLAAALDAPQVDPAAAISLRAAAATLYTMSSQWLQGRALFHDALARSAALGDPEVRRAVLLNSHVGLGHPDDRALRREVADELRAGGDPEARWEGNFLAFGLALIDADRAALDATAAAMADEFPHVAQRRRTSGMMQVGAMLALLDGNLDAAERDALAAYQASRVAQTESWALSTLAAAIYPIREAQGRLGELRDAVHTLRSNRPDFPLWISVESAIAAWQGDLDTVRVGLTEMAAQGYQFERDLTWGGVVVLAMRAAWAGADAQAAQALYDQLLPYAGTMSWNGVATQGPIDAALALGAMLLGRTDDAAAHLATADELLARLGAPHLRWAELQRLA